MARPPFPSVTLRAGAALVLVLGAGACSASPGAPAAERAATAGAGTTTEAAPAPPAGAARTPDHGGAGTAPAHLGHVHGLGLNPADGLVYVAAHEGLFVLDGGAAHPVGDVRHDTMGFTVTGPDTFLASGHPAPGQPGPDNLGLLRSADAGRTWRAVSAAGSDFHALTAAGEHVVGLDSATGALRRSTDGGSTWRDGPALPARTVDLDPADPERLLATTAEGLLQSGDGGATFLPHPVQPPERLLLVDHVPDHDPTDPGDGVPAVVGLDETGRLWTWDGAAWTASGVVGAGGPPAALTAEAGGVLLVAVGAEVLRSDDGGRSWATVAAAGR